jgi:soluble lytic murein transglycosylase-like protein
MVRDDLVLAIGILALAGAGYGGYVYMSNWKNRATLAVGSDQFNALMSILNGAESQYGIPQDLLARQAWQESSFDPNAQSPAGAQGLLQFMPATWAQYGGGGNVFDPQTAATAGAQYMAALFKQFGAWSLALAAYNAGPGNVSKYGGIPPFAETQNYVSKIISDVNSEGGAQLS